MDPNSGKFYEDTPDNKLPLEWTRFTVGQTVKVIFTDRGVNRTKEMRMRIDSIEEDHMKMVPVLKDEPYEIIDDLEVAQRLASALDDWNDGIE